MSSPRSAVLACVGLLLGTACSKKDEGRAGSAAMAPAGKRLKIGLVTDVGGRGDQSFNDSALRGLELWAAGKKYTNHTYRDLSGDELQRSIPAELASLRP